MASPTFQGLVFTPAPPQPPGTLVQVQVQMTDADNRVIHFSGTGTDDAGNATPFTGAYSVGEAITYTLKADSATVTSASGTPNKDGRFTFTT